MEKLVGPGYRGPFKFNEECRKKLKLIKAIEDTDHENSMIRPQLWESSSSKKRLLVSLCLILALSSRTDWLGKGLD